MYLTGGTRGLVCAEVVSVTVRPSGRGVDADRQRPGGDPRLQQHAELGVVAEPQVLGAEVDHRVPARRVLRYVQAVVAPLDHLEPGQEHRVEQRRRHLADAAADAGHQLSVDQDARLLVPVGHRPLAGSRR